MAAQNGDRILQVHSVQHALTGKAENRVASVRLLDHYAATTIASYACIRMSDGNGNPSEAYWKCFVLEPGKQCGLLMNVATVEKVMIDLMNKMIEKHEAALLQINDDVAVCKWLMAFKAKWEDEYREQTKKAYDIAEPVLAVMQEAVLKTDRVFEAHARHISCSAVRRHFKRWYDSKKEEPEELSKSLPMQQAVTRFYFRHADLAQHMCLIAGKIWKLQEVCDKPGAFPSTKQQNLLQKQLQDSITNLVVVLNRERFDLPTEEETALYCMDHKTADPVRHLKF
jgi:hypothetical protein